MAQIVEIRLEPLTAESFAPFGQLLAERDTPPVFQASHLRSWRMNFEVDGAAQLLVVRYVHEPFACHLLERHLSVTQAFVPLGEHPSVMVAAPPTDLDEPDRVPRPDEVRAFYVPGSCGLMLWRGTWHALTRFPVRSDGASFLMVTGADTQRELEREKADGTRPRLTQVVDYGERADLRFSIVDPDGLLLHSLEHLVT